MNMKASRLTKSPHILFTASSIFSSACCILVMKSLTRTGGNDGTVASQYSACNSKSNELAQVLRRASMEDGTVMLTTIVDEAWTRPGSVLGLFLKSFQIGQGTKRLLNHLVIVTLGSQAFQSCNVLHPHCFQLKPFESRKGPLALDNLMFQRNTNNLLLQVLGLGYSFIFTEADVIWLRTPIVHIHPSYEITIPCSLHAEDSQNRSNKPGRGLFYVKSNAASIELSKHWKVWGTLYPDSRVKSMCEAFKEQQDVIEMLGVRIQYLNATYFGGFCLGESREIQKVYTLQATCCDNVEDKVHDLKLVIEDWIKFRAQSFNISLERKESTNQMHSIRVS